MPRLSLFKGRFFLFPLFMKKKKAKEYCLFVLKKLISCVYFASVHNVSSDSVSSKDIHLFSGLLLTLLGHERSDVNFICAGVS